MKAEQAAKATLLLIAFSRAVSQRRVLDEEIAACVQLEQQPQPSIIHALDCAFEPFVRSRSDFPKSVREIG